MLRHPHHLAVYGEETIRVPSHLNFGKYILEVIWSGKDKIAVINGHTNEKLAYGELAKLAMSLAVSLTRMGIKKGDVIGICSENRQEYLPTVFGICCSGATATVLNSICTQDELKHLLGVSKPKMLFCSPHAYKNHAKVLETLPYLEWIVLFGKERPNSALLYGDMILQDVGDLSLERFEVPDVMGQTDTAIILYSSGTTGLPKGVMLTHLNLITTCELPSSGNTAYNSMFIAPWYHAMGLMGMIRWLTSLATAVYLVKFDADLYLRTIEKYAIVQLAVAPPVLVAVSKSQARYDVRTVRMIYSGAAPLRDDTITAVKKRFPNLLTVVQGYGMTETTLGVLRGNYEYKHWAKNKLGSVGQIVPGCVIKIVDVVTKKTLGPNQPGEVYIKGPTVMKGYVNQDSRDMFDDEGFLKSGDIAYYDEDKYFFVVDRLKELIKYKGYQVAPAELEAVLLQLPGVIDAGVVGVPDPSGGEVPLAFVVRQPGSNINEEDIKSFVAKKLSNYKHLRGGVRYVGEIPKNPSGKILRKRLREMVKSTSKL